MVVIIIDREVRRLRPYRHAQSLLTARNTVSAIDTQLCRSGDVTAAFSQASSLPKASATELQWLIRDRLCSMFVLMPRIVKPSILSQQRILANPASRPAAPGSDRHRHHSQRRWPRPKPIVFAFCRTAPSVRFMAFATSATGVLAFEWAFSCRRSSLVQGLRDRVFFLGWEQE